MTEKTKESKRFALSFTEEELKNPMIKRAIVDFALLRAGMHSTEPFWLLDEAEVEVMKLIPLFTSADVAGYGEKKYPNEVGKFKGKSVCKR